MCGCWSCVATTILNLCITNTQFRQKLSHKNTWLSPDGKTCNLVDYIITRNEKLTSFCNTRAYRGAEIDSDHYLVVSEIKVKLAAVRTKNRSRRFDVSKLTDGAIRQDFEITVGGRFAALSDVRNDAEKEWKQF